MLKPALAQCGWIVHVEFVAIGALIVGVAPYLEYSFNKILAEAALHKIPAIYPHRRVGCAPHRQGVPDAGAVEPAQGLDAYQRDVSQQSLRRHGRAGDQDHRRFYLQAAQEARQRLGRQGLHRDGLGVRLCTARTDRGRGEGLRLTISARGLSRWQDCGGRSSSRRCRSRARPPGSGKLSPAARTASSIPALSRSMPTMVSKPLRLSSPETSWVSFVGFGTRGGFL